MLNSSDDIKRRIVECNNHAETWAWERALPLVERLERELSELREWKADVMESQRAIMSEICAGDEKHCTCVPDLRRALKETQQESEDRRMQIVGLLNELAQSSFAHEAVLRMLVDVCNQIEEWILTGNLVNRSPRHKWHISEELRSMLAEAAKLPEVKP